MRRRELLAATGGMFATGCVGRQGVSEGAGAPTTEPAATQSGTTSTAVSGTDTEGPLASEPTVKPTPTPMGAEVLYAPGEWHSMNYFAFSFTDAKFQSEFTDTWPRPPETHTMPAGKLLGCARMELKNIHYERRAAPFILMDTFALLTTDEIYEARGSFEHPSYEETVSMGTLKPYGDVSLVGSQSFLDSGEAVPRWAGFVVDEDVAGEKFTIGYGGPGGHYPLQWQLE